MRPRNAAATMAMLVLLGACSSDRGAEPDQQTGSGSAIAVANIAYTPASLEISVGDTVTWTSEDAGVRHTVTSGLPAGDTVPGVNKGAPAKPDGTFDGELADAGSSFTFTFDRAGSYAYFCEVHPSMTAEITVD